MKEQEHDPEGFPINRELSRDEVEVTSPMPLSGKPSGFIVGGTAPGASQAPEVAVEAPKAARGNSIPEYHQPDHAGLPETITAKQIQADRSNPDGCIASEVQR